ncbi:hypothetical protein Tco_0977830 [Tanacetum coccineum]|uniref:Uncharacterized protein n=1 Tax=Tanacetum coccineum TaxID=301880 RepID=A0ABQ5EL87_9ASTR
MENLGKMEKRKGWLQYGEDGSAGDDEELRGDGVTGIKRRRRDLSGKGVRNLATALGRGRPKETLEDFVSRD